LATSKGLLPLGPNQVAPGQDKPHLAPPNPPPAPGARQRGIYTTGPITGPVYGGSRKRKRYAGGIF
jgi:hypothetical protein